jgi:hypothetical protein
MRSLFKRLASLRVTLLVIAGLVPAISIIRHDCASLSGMAGTSPAMTN